MPKGPVQPRAIFSARLKQARDLVGIDSQRALGVMLGLDKKLASSRINRYETQARGIDLDGLAKLADALGVPMAFLVAEDPATAQIIFELSKMSPVERGRLVAQMKLLKDERDAGLED